MKKRGRSKGSTGPSRGHLAPIQNWKVRHDKIVLLHLAGLSNKEIAAALDLTEQRVSQVLQDPLAKQIIAAGRDAIRKKLLSDVEDRIVHLAHRSLENIEETVNAEISPLHPMKRHQDKLGLELLSMIGYHRAPAPTPAGPSVPAEVFERLTRALERSERVREEIVLEAEIVPD